MRLLLALCLGLVALAAASQSPLQRRVVKEVLDSFHGRVSVHFLFKEQAVEGAVERVSAGAAEAAEPPAPCHQGWWGGGRGDGVSWRRAREQPQGTDGHGGQSSATH